MISLITGVDKNWLIGNGGKLPWNIPEDLAYFKKITNGHSIVMGRKTFESIGRPLPNRTNIILTKDENYKAEGCVIINSKESLEIKNDEEVFVIGGANVYKQFLPLADKLYITKIDGEYYGDVYFPKPDMKKWKLSSEDPQISKKGVILTFQIYIKN